VNASSFLGRSVALLAAIGGLGCWFDVPDLGSTSGAGAGSGPGGASGASGGGGSGCGSGSPIVDAFTTPLTITKFLAADDGIVMAGTRSGALKCGGKTLPSSDHEPGEIVHLDDAGHCTWGIDVVSTGFGASVKFAGGAIDAAGSSHFVGTSFGEIDGTTVKGEFVLKVDAHGSLEPGKGWIVLFSGNSRPGADDVAAAPDGGDIVAGKFIAQTPWSTSVGVLTGGGFVMRLGPSGSAVWAASFDTQANIMAVRRLISGPAGESVLLADGATMPVKDFNGVVAPGPGGALAAKLDPGGTQVWANTFGGDPGVIVQGAALDADGDVFVVGTFKSTFVAGKIKLKPTEDTNLFVAKLDASNGDVTFARTLGGVPANLPAIDVAADADGKHVWIASSLLDPLNFGCGLIEPLGGGDVVLAELGTDGQPLFAARYGTPLPESTLGIQRSPNGTVRLAGTFQNELDLGSVKLEHGPTSFIATIGDP
jgi:hypothetical protein